MSKINYNIERDLYELTTMSLTFEHYITQEDIFYAPKGMMSTMPTMTLGTFLMRLRRLTALQSQMDIGSRAQLGIALKAHEAVLSEWAFHYHQKLRNELETRMRFLDTFFDELSSKSPQESIKSFVPELLARTAMEELLIQAKTTVDLDPVLVDHIDEVDKRWKDVTHASYFHWDEKLRTVYPQSHFWWLYTELDMEKEVVVQ